MFSSSIFYREDEKVDLVIEENIFYLLSLIFLKFSNFLDWYGLLFV